MKINKKEFLTYIFCFLLLIYPFNATLKARFFQKEIIMIILCLISLIGLFLLGVGKWKKLYKKQLLYLIITFIVFGIQITNNYYFKESSEAKVIYFSLYLFLPFVLSNNSYACNIMIKVTKFFCLEHIFGTFFVQFFKDYYISNILPWLSNYRANVALSNLKNGYNPGITMHYSTNGMYLSIASILFFSEYLNSRKKKTLWLTILSLIALLLTGKRAHTLFTLMACISLYLYKYKDSISKKVMNFFAVALVGVVGIFVLSSFMPQVLNVVERFETTIEKGELLSGREPFYELAIDLWNKHKFFGNGWGAFSYYFQTEIYTSVFTYGYLDAHNVYLQLLCEIGIVGLIFFLILGLGIIIKNSNLIKNQKENNLLLMFSFAYQIYFLLYCFSGNPLYDIQAYAVYFISIGIVLNSIIEKGKEELEMIKDEKNKCNNTGV